MTDILIIASIGILGLVIIIYFFGGGLRKDRRNYYRNQWAKILNKAKGDMNAQTLAVIEADKLFDQLLKERGFKGETMGHRLKHAAPSLSNANKLWRVHKFRNKLVHENVTISRKQVLAALRVYEAEMKKLGAL